MENIPVFFETQPLVAPLLLKSVKHGRLAHAYLFEGNRGTGKHQAALWLAKEMFCQHKQSDQPCNTCNNCLRIDGGIHPDVLVIEPDGQTIKVDQIRQLQTEFSKSGFEGQQKVFILKDAEKMNTNAANSLLKFLEEPAAAFLAILETTALTKILPTIQSRCQILHFQALSKQTLQSKLQAEGIGQQTAALLTDLTNSYDKAVEISQNEWFNEAKESMTQWFTYLKNHDLQSFIYVQKKLVAIFKEKQQQQQGLSILLHLFHEYLQQEVKNGSRLKIATINAQVQLILEAERKLSANVSFQNVAEQLALRMANMNL